MADLRKSGIDANPSLVTDRMLDGRKQKSSTSHTWYLDLSAADRSKAVRYETMRSVVKFPCASPDPFAQMVALRWAASVTGQGDVYDKNSKRTVTGSAATKTEQQIRTVVADVLTEPIAAQANWFKRTLTLGCSGSQS
ncbi:hypothetical protein [Streptomyces sp. NPDC006012]|uniref:hypothetical protein n=1 Tax=Streptomyces sp. NPDC006012 TaxID=3364739 RepID=UPI0036B772C1